MSMRLERPKRDVERRCARCGRSVHLNFNRNGDLLFHFFRGAARPLRNDLHVVVGDVGIGFDGQIVKRDRPPDQQEHGRWQER